MLRLAALDDVANARPADLRSPPHVLALLRALAPHWHDGDENLVRGHLDRWKASGTRADEARAFLDAGASLCRHARVEALWYWAWTVETTITGWRTANDIRADGAVESAGSS